MRYVRARTERRQLEGYNLPLLRDTLAVVVFLAGLVVAVPGVVVFLLAWWVASGLVGE